MYYCNTFWVFEVLVQFNRFLIKPNLTIKSRGIIKLQTEGLIKKSVTRKMLQGPDEHSKILNTRARRVAC